METIKIGIKVEFGDMPEVFFCTPEDKRNISIVFEINEGHCSVCAVGEEKVDPKRVSQMFKEVEATDE